MINLKHEEGKVIYEWSLGPGMMSLLERNTFVFETHSDGVRLYIHPCATFGEPRNEQFVSYSSLDEYHLSLGIPLPDFPRSDNDDDDEDKKRFKNQINQNLRAVLRNREVPLVFGSRNIGSVILKLEDVVPA